MQGLAAEEAPVMLGHMASELAVKLAVKLAVELLAVLLMELLAVLLIELLAGQMVERVIAADASMYQQALSKIPIASC